MVIPDAAARAPQFTEDVPAPAVQPGLAPPLHRLAAVIVDVCVVLAPVYLVVSAPLKRAMTAAALTGSGEPAFYSVIMFWIAFAIGVVYQAYMHHHYRATLGKRLFGLEVRSSFGRATLGTHVVRSLGWMISVGLGGLPFLAVWSHERRRPLHDRLGETVVVALEGGVGAPAEFSRGLVRVAYVASAILVVLGILWSLSELAHRGGDERAAVGGEECDIVSRYANDDTNDEHSRVHLAMTLYAAGLADRSCLESEVERESAAQIPLAPLTYLAQAFFNADDPEVSNAYLDRVCADAPGSAECAMSEVVSHWSNDNWEGIERELASAPRGSGYLEVWGVRHHMRRANFTAALNGLDRLIDRPEIADFTIEERVRALYGEARIAEAREAFKQAATVLEPEVGRELSAWTCVQEFARGCSAVGQVACARVAAQPRTADESATIGLARLRTDECRVDVHVDYLELADTAIDPDWANFFRGSAKIAGADRAGAVDLLNLVIDSESSTDLLRVEALRRLALVSSKTELRDLVERWNDFDSRPARALARPILVERLAARGDRELETLVERDAVPTTSMRAPASTDEE